MSRNLPSIESHGPDCGPTLDRLQQFLDGDMPTSALETDAHASTCPACRDRIAAAQLLTGVLATPSRPRRNTELTDAIVHAIREDQTSHLRRRTFAAAIGLVGVLAASVMLVAWLRNPEPVVPIAVPRVEAKLEPRPTAPDPRPARIGNEFAKVGQALLETSRPITDPAVQAPALFSKLTASLTRPLDANDDFDAARRSLADLPDAARTGLEPVTATTQKAFARLLRDVGGMQVSVKPKS